LPYIHYIVLLDPKHLTGNHETVSQYLAETYHSLIDTMVEGFRASTLTAESHPLSYNFLMTHTWMMIVPRLNEDYKQISVNSLGFAGRILVKSDEELEFVKKVGSIHILESVAISKDKNQLINGIHN
jgi:sulfate adenylyltransferase (ADP) / ATP adenylyltransferase